MRPDRAGRLQVAALQLDQEHDHEHEQEHEHEDEKKTFVTFADFV